MENPESQNSGLDDLRSQIEAVDAQFAKLLGERQRLATRIVAKKIESGLPLRNYSLESRVIERFEDLCRAEGLEPRWGIDLAGFLIGKSVEAQSTVLERRRNGHRLKVLVVGGLGKMGRWTGEFLYNQGHEVAVFDTTQSGSPFKRFDRLDGGVKWADLTIVSVPLADSADVLGGILELRPRGVVFDICSLKKKIVELLRGAAASGLKVTSVHPLFGPDTVTLYGRNVVVCTCGSSEADSVARSLFAETAANLVTLAPEEHDRLMSLTLGISHALNLVFARTLARSGAGYNELKTVASSTFSRQVETTREVAGENMALYLEIQRQCDIGAIYDGLTRELAAVRYLVEEGRENDFKEAMDVAKQFFFNDAGENDTQEDL